MEKKDILTLEDIMVLVDTFYTSVRKDADLGPVFEAKLKNRWPEHLEKMYRFWQTILFQEHTYFGSPFPPHAQLPIEAMHFEKWLALFTETVDACFKGEKADETKWRAGKMAELFSSKIECIRRNDTISIL